MQVNYNAFHARLYRWFYNTNTMPKTLCLYFWKLVIVFITIVPAFIIRIPVELTIFKNDKDRNGDYGNILISGISLWSIIFFIFCMIAMWWVSKDSPIFITGAISYVIIIPIVSVLLFSYIKDKITDKYIKISVEKRKSILVESVKAIYKKYCPIIEWKK
jgi:di/tricarboxylate transporter